MSSSRRAAGRLGLGGRGGLVVVARVALAAALVAAIPLAAPRAARAAEGEGAARVEVAVDPLRAQANAARIAVLENASDAEARLDAAWRSAADRPATEPGIVAIRLHLLRTRMLLLGIAAGEARGERSGPAPVAAKADPEAHAQLAADLAALEAEARAQSLAGPRAFALLYTAELAAARGDSASARAKAERVLLLPESEATWEAQVLAEALRERILSPEAARSPAAAQEALDGLRRARGILERVRPRVEADLHLARARPIHERLAERLLAAAEREAGAGGEAADADAEQARLREALDVLEDLKRAELRAYFGDPCLASLAPTTPERLPGARLLYPALLGDRVVLILGRDGRLAQQRAPIARAELEAESRRLRGALQDPTSPRYRTAASRLYEALIRPLEAAPIALLAGAEQPAPTLVFVPSGALREIPLAALFDARDGRFLIEKTAIATLPTLRIEPPRALDRRRTELLAVALTGAVEDLPPLPFAGREVAAIAQTFPTTSRLDAEFSQAGFAAALDLRPFDIVHVASHGRFDARASESFLHAHDGRITLQGLGDLIAKTRHRTRRPLELLVLSACETAIGDERAVLGLAGVAVQSGARSAVASLWKVHDEATMELFATFYRELARPGVGRAEALRRAQQALLAEPRFRHPIFWSAFLLVNGWL